MNKHTVGFVHELTAIYNVGFFQFSEDSFSSHGLQDTEINDDVEIHDIYLRRASLFGRIVSYAEAAIKFLFVIRKYEFVYVFMPGNLSIVCSIICRFTRTPYAIYLRGDGLLGTRLGRYIARRAQFSLSVSAFFANQLRGINDNASVIHPMLDFNQSDAYFRSWEPETTTFRCLFVGRISKEKGVFDLMEAIRLLNRSPNNIHFDIIGDGDSYSYLQKVCGHFSNVHIKGLISDKTMLREFYRQSDLFLFPSHTEGFPRVLYEAMISDLPILTTMVGGIPSLMIDDYNCLAIEVGSPDSILMQLRKLQVDKELRMRLAKNGHATMQKVFALQPHSELLVKKLEGEDFVQ